MPLKYWDEAFLATTHLINHLPTKVLNFFLSSREFVQGETKLQWP
jgi:hypothetical protein